VAPWWQMINKKHQNNMPSRHSAAGRSVAFLFYLDGEKFIIVLFAESSRK
jgi:hypothetical protein